VVSGLFLARQEGNVMATKRGEERDFELRLGAFQVVIWLGLAVGAVVGGYFIGFIQGRGVGYEEGRAPSAVEVAKLAVDDAVPGAGVVADSDVFERLNTAPSAPSISDTPPKKAAKGSDESVAAKVAQDIKLADEAARLAAHSKQDAKGVEPVVAGVPTASELVEKREKIEGGLTGGSQNGRASAPDSLDRAAAIPSSTGASVDNSELDLFDGSGGSVETGSAPANVRMLGTDPLVEDSSKRDKEKTLGAILDERVETARGIGAKGDTLGSGAAGVTGVGTARDSAPPASVPTLVAAAQPTSPPKEPTPFPRQPTPAPTPTRKPETKVAAEVAVKKVLPAGFFAQVAAPTKLADAESVARKLRQSGFPVVVEEADVRGELFYRVLVGPEENKVQADRLLQQLKSERYLTSVPFIRRVK
jgi:cell division septation protein DedD